METREFSSARQSDLAVPRLALQVLAVLAFHSVTFAQSDDAVRERSRLLSDPELAATFVLDVIRQGIQTGNVERMLGVFDPAYYEEVPARGKRLGRVDLVTRLKEAIGRAESRRPPQGYEHLSGLYDFGWSDIEIHISQGSDGLTEATVHVQGSSARMSSKVRVMFRLRRSTVGWKIVTSRRFSELVNGLGGSAG
jgi:hypothetical protein